MRAASPTMTSRPLPHATDLITISDPVLRAVHANVSGSFEPFGSLWNGLHAVIAERIVSIENAKTGKRQVFEHCMSPPENFKLNIS
jgi:hypothetical protein